MLPPAPGPRWRRGDAAAPGELDEESAGASRRRHVEMGRRGRDGSGRRRKARRAEGGGGRRHAGREAARQRGEDRDHSVIFS